MKAKLTPHQRIMRAAERGTGLYLSADEVAYLSGDDAIETRASLDNERAENPVVFDLWQRYLSAVIREDKAELRQQLVDMGEL